LAIITIGGMQVNADPNVIYNPTVGSWILQGGPLDPNRVVPPLTVQPPPPPPPPIVPGVGVGSALAGYVGSAVTGAGVNPRGPTPDFSGGLMSDVKAWGQRVVNTLSDPKIAGLGGLAAGAALGYGAARVFGRGGGGGGGGSFGLRGMRPQMVPLGIYTTPSGQEVTVSQTRKGQPYVAKAEVLRVYGRSLSPTEYAAEFGVYPKQRGSRIYGRGYRRRWGRRRWLSSGRRSYSYRRRRSARMLNDPVARDAAWYLSRGGEPPWGR